MTLETVDQPYSVSLLALASKHRCAYLLLKSGEWLTILPTTVGDVRVEGYAGPEWRLFCAVDLDQIVGMKFGREIEEWELKAAGL